MQEQFLPISFYFAVDCQDYRTPPMHYIPVRPPSSPPPAPLFAALQSLSLSVPKKGLITAKQKQLLGNEQYLEELTVHFDVNSVFGWSHMGPRESASGGSQPARGVTWVHGSQPVVGLSLQWESHRSMGVSLQWESHGSMGVSLQWESVCSGSHMGPWQSDSGGSQPAVGVTWVHWSQPVVGVSLQWESHGSMGVSQWWGSVCSWSHMGPWESASGGHQPAVWLPWVHGSQPVVGISMQWESLGSMCFSFVSWQSGYDRSQDAKELQRGSLGRLMYRLRAFSLGW
jgi:hypothetical protein